MVVFILDQIDHCNEFNAYYKVTRTREKERERERKNVIIEMAGFKKVPTRSNIIWGALNM